MNIKSLTEWAHDARILDVTVKLANSASSRGIVGIPVVFYPRTKTGTLGSGAHPGFVRGITPSDAQQLGLDWTALVPLEDCVQDENGRPICRECFVTDGDAWPQDAVTEEGLCWSCVQMYGEWLDETTRDLANYCADDSNTACTGTDDCTCRA